MPSRMEAFGKTCAEAISCGTPSIAFADTGASDIIDHKNTGYLVSEFSPQALAHGINWTYAKLFSDSTYFNSLCRTSALAKLDTSVSAEKYIRLYQSILNK